MGASESKGPATSQSMEQRQANQNRIIDQSRDLNAFMQLNWASFGSGVSSVCIIITLSVLLFFCWQQNKKANSKQHEARLHEIAVIAGRESGRRHHGHHSTPIRDNILPYPPSIVQPSFSPFPGAPSYGCSPLSSFSGLQAPTTAGTLHQLQQFQQLQQLSALGLSGMAPLASSPADWPRIHELGSSGNRQNASSGPSSKPTVSGPVPAPRGSGNPLHDFPGYGAKPKHPASPPMERPSGNPYKFLSTMQVVLDCLEAEENAEDQL